MVSGKTKSELPKEYWNLVVFHLLWSELIAASFSPKLELYNLSTQYHPK